jgi:beta-hydroxylase
MARYDDFAPFQDISPDQTYISNDDKWRMFFLKGAGMTFKKNTANFPVLMKVLNRHKSVVSAYLSVLGPDKALNPHEGPWAGVLRMHMGLIIPDPEKCHINVEGDKYHWRNGTVVLFDDTYNHYAVNETDQLRVILFLDYMRPMKFPYNLFNWTVMKTSWAFPYIWRPLLRHRRWSQKFYSDKLPVT